MSTPAGYPVLFRAVHRPKLRHLPKLPARQVEISPRIAALLAKPSWSVKSLLPDQKNAQSTTPTMTPEQLRHLLRLSALPQPNDEKEERDMLETLESQIHFVREIQKVDTTGVEPLCVLRDETAAGAEDQTVRLADLQEYLDAEEVVGRNGRIRRGDRHDPVARMIERWDPFAMSEGKKRMGRYFFVRKGRKTGPEEFSAPKETADS